MNENKSRDRFPAASILKQKIKLPLDVDITGSCVESTPTARAKRVSFKRVSFIKPFISDVDDKNTIWDNTYEEEVNHTDSTHSNQESLPQKGEQSVFDALNTTTVFPDEENNEKSALEAGDFKRCKYESQNTLLFNESMEFTQLVGISGRPNKTTYDVTMDLTTLPLVDKENMNIDGTPGLRNKASILTFAKRLGGCYNQTNQVTFFNNSANNQTCHSMLHVEKASANTDGIKVNDAIHQIVPADADLNEVPMEMSFSAQTETCPEDMEISYCNLPCLPEANIEFSNDAKQCRSEADNAVENKNKSKNQSRSALAIINPAAVTITATNNSMRHNMNNKFTNELCDGPVEAALVCQNFIKGVENYFVEDSESSLDARTGGCHGSISGGLGRTRGIDMEFTCNDSRSLTSRACLNLLKSAGGSEVNMDLTCHMSSTSVDPDVQVSNESMQLTGKLSPVTDTVKRTPNLQSVYKRVPEADKENTNSITDIVDANGPNCNIASFKSKHSQRNHNVTCHVPNNPEGITQSHVAKSRNKMELDSQSLATKLNVSDIQIQNESMQLTCQFPPARSLKTDHITPQSISKERADTDKENINPHKHFVKDRSRLSVLTSENYLEDNGMQFTCQSLQEREGSGKSVDSACPVNVTSGVQLFDESMQFTCKFPPLESLKTNEAYSKTHIPVDGDKENIVCEGSEEKTDHSLKNPLVTPEDYQYVNDPVFKRTELNTRPGLSKLTENSGEIMEFSSLIPSVNLNIISNDQILDESMQFTCKFPPFKTLNTENTIGADKGILEANVENTNIHHEFVEHIGCDSERAEKASLLSVSESKESLVNDMKLMCRIPVCSHNDTKSSTADSQIDSKSPQFTCKISSLPSMKVDTCSRDPSKIQEETAERKDINTPNSYEGNADVVSKQCRVSGGDMEFTCQIPVCSPNVGKQYTSDDQLLNKSMEFTCQFTAPKCSKTELSEDSQPALQKVCEVIEVDKENINPNNYNQKNNQYNFKISVPPLENKMMNVGVEFTSENMELTCKVSPSTLKRHHEKLKTSGVEILDDSMVSTCKLPRLEISSEEPKKKVEENTYERKERLDVTSQKLISEVASKQQDKIHDASTSRVSDEGFYKVGNLSCGDGLHQSSIPDSSNKQNLSSAGYAEASYLKHWDMTKDEHDKSQGKIFVGEQDVISNIHSLNDNSVCFVNYMRSNMSLTASVNFDLKSLSSCIDDTQKLINCNLSRPFKETSNISSSFGLHNSDAVPCQITENDVALPGIDDTYFEGCKCLGEHSNLEVWENEKKSLQDSSVHVPKVMQRSLPKFVMTGPNSTDVIEITDSKSFAKNEDSHVQITGNTFSVSKTVCKDSGSLNKAQDSSTCNDEIKPRKRKTSIEFFEEVNSSVRINLAHESSSILDQVDLCISDENIDVPVDTTKSSSGDLEQALKNIKLDTYSFSELKFTNNISKMWNSKGVDWMNRMFDDIKLKIAHLKEIYQTVNSLSESSTSESAENDMALSSLHEVELSPKHTSLLQKIHEIESLHEVELAPKPTALLQKIHEIEQRCAPYWEFVKEEENRYYFSTLHDTLKLTVQINSEGVIWDMQMVDNLSDKANSLAKYAHKLLMETLSQKNLESTLGMRYDILSFLDYLCLTVQNMVEFMTSFETLNMVMEPVNIVTTRILDVDLILNWVIKIDVTDLKNVQPEHVTLQVKTVSYKENDDSAQRHENAIKHFVNLCPKGMEFFKAFREHLEGYITLLSKRSAYALKSQKDNID